MVEDSDHSFDNVVAGEVSDDLAVVEDRDGLAGQDAARELEKGHVRRPPSC